MKKRVEIGDLRMLMTRVFYTRSHQLFDYIAAISDQIGPCNVRISTFSNSEEFLRRMRRFRTSGRFVEMKLVSDRRALTKTLRQSALMRNVYDHNYLAANHGKMVLMWNDSYCVSILTSQNQTRGSRYEVHTVTTDRNVYDELQRSWEDIISHATMIDNILARRVERDREDVESIDSD